MSKKEQIIETAIRLFVEQGFENTPTSQISKEAKVATGTLFHHFATKEELINTAYLQVKRANHAAALQGYDESLDVETRLKKMWAFGTRWSFEHRTETQFMYKFLGSAYITPETQAEYQESWEPFNRTMAQGVEEGLFKDLPGELMFMFMVSLSQALLNYLYQKGEYDEKMVKAVCDLLWEAITK